MSGKIPTETLMNDNNTLLTGIRLVNWYGYGDVDYPIGPMTLIHGENKTGKTVLLDAIQYAAFGITDFNKSTEITGSTGDRTVMSYVRGLREADSGECMRPYSTDCPHTYTHIVLEWHDQLNNEYFLTGVSIDAYGKGNNECNKYRYVMENTRLKDIHHTYKDESGDMVPYSPTELEEKYGISMTQGMTEGISEASRAIGLKIMDGNEQRAFNRKLRNIINYRPTAKVDEFVKKQMLEPDPIDMSGLIKTRKDISSARASLSGIKAEVDIIEEIEKLYDEYEGIIKESQKNELLESYYKVKEQETLLQKCNDKINRVEECEKNLSQKADELEIKISRKHKQVEEAEANLKALDVDNAISNARNNRDGLIAEEKKLKGEEGQLYSLQETVNEAVGLLTQKGSNIPDAIREFMKSNGSVRNADVLRSLYDGNQAVEDKSAAVTLLQQKLDSFRVFLGIKIAEKRKMKRDKENKWAEQEKRKNENERCTGLSRYPAEYIAFKDRINHVFVERGIHAEAKFACEYVTRLTDESWRRTIETLLGPQRYTIIVPPEYYKVADELFNEIRPQKVRLFNTELLAKEPVQAVNESLADYLVISDPTARKYFDFRLGNIHAVAIGDVCKYRDAASREGRLSKAMENSFLDFSRIDQYDQYMLGEESFGLNVENAKKIMQKLDNEIKETDREISILERLQEKVGRNLKIVSMTYNYNAKQELAGKHEEVERAKKFYEELETAKQKDAGFIELNNTLKTRKKEYNALTEDKIKLTGEIATAKARKDASKEEKRVTEANRINYLNNYAIKKDKDPRLARQVEDEYEKYLAAGKKMKPLTVKEIYSPDGNGTLSEWWDASTGDGEEVTVTGGKTSTVTVTNTYKTGNVQITKTIETADVSTYSISGESGYNASLAGFAFHLYGTGTSGASVDLYAVTDSSGVATFTGVPIGTYSVIEVSKSAVATAASSNSSAAAIKDSVTQDLAQYLAPTVISDVTVAYDDVGHTDLTTEVTYHNPLKQWRITITKLDSVLLESGKTQQGASLEGAVYALYDGDGYEVARYETDINGQFTTDYYICGDNWYIHEISASPGYLVDDTKYYIAASADLFTEQYNTAHLSDGSYINGYEDCVYEDPITGSVTVIKYGSNGTTKLDGVEYTLYDSDGNIKATGTTGNDGTGTIVFDELLPGTYILTETKTMDGYSLLADEITVTIPMTITKEDYDAYTAAGISIDLTDAVEQGDGYWFYDLTYEITDTSNLALPYTGPLESMDDENGLVKIFAGLVMLAAVVTAISLIWERKKKMVGKPEAQE